MKINAWTIVLGLAVVAGIGIVAYEQGKGSQASTDAGVLTNIQTWLNSTF